MNEMLSLIKLDFIAVKNKSMIPTVIIAVIIIVAGFMVAPHFITLATYVMPLMFVSLFSIAEKNNFNKLYGTLPIKRNSIVYSRFLGGALTVTVTNLVTMLIALIAEKSELYLGWGNDDIRSFTSNISTLFESNNISIGLFAAVMFVVTCAFVGLTYLIDFVFGTEKEAQATVLAMIIFMGIVLFLKYVLKTHIIETLADFSKDFMDKSTFLFFVFVYVIGLAILGMFAFITNSIVGKREL